MPEYSEQFLSATEGFETIEAALEYLEACKPLWATGINKYGEIKEGTQLLTRDGRITGNARVMETPFNLVTVVTDAGNVLSLYPIAVHSMFHIGLFFILPLGSNLSE